VDDSPTRKPPRRMCGSTALSPYLGSASPACTRHGCRPPGGSGADPTRVRVQTTSRHSSMSGAAAGCLGSSRRPCYRYKRNGSSAAPVDQRARAGGPTRAQLLAGRVCAVLAPPALPARSVGRTSTQPTRSA
jgi:hypothetical protein